MAGAIAQKFKKLFPDITHPFVDGMLSALYGEYRFDIIAFDDWLHLAHGYKELEHGSMADFLESHWSKQHSDFIKGLI